MFLKVVCCLLRAKIYHKYAQLKVDSRNARSSEFCTRREHQNNS